MNEPHSNQDKDFATLDVAFIRVLEDLIDALIKKGVLRLTDLPVEAQQKQRLAAAVKQRFEFAR